MPKYSSTGKARKTGKPGPRPLKKGLKQVKAMPKCTEQPTTAGISDVPPVKKKPSDWDDLEPFYAAPKSYSKPPNRATSERFEGSRPGSSGGSGESRVGGGTGQSGGRSGRGDGMKGRNDLASGSDSTVATK